MKQKQYDVSEQPDEVISQFLPMSVNWQNPVKVTHVLSSITTLLSLYLYPIEHWQRPVHCDLMQWIKILLGLDAHPLEKISEHGRGFCKCIAQDYIVVQAVIFFKGIDLGGGHGIGK